MAANKPNLELTTTEKRTLEFYQEHLDKYRAPPPVRWLAEQLGGVYPNAVAHTLKRLTFKGYLAPAPITMIKLTLTDKAKKRPR